MEKSKLSGLIAVMATAGILNLIVLFGGFTPDLSYGLESVEKGMAVCVDDDIVYESCEEGGSIPCKVPNGCPAT